MAFLPRIPPTLLLVLVLAVSFVHCDESSSSSSPESPQVTDIEGTDICSEREGCLCDMKLTPLEISCQATNLHVMYEQSDWLATFEANNISSNASLNVRFDNNALVTVPKFSPMPIVILILRRNNISVIEDGAFAELKELNHLDLSYNNLTSASITEKAFMGLYNESGYFPLPVLHLNLTHNKIHSLDKNVFDHFVNLQTLDLSHNPLKTLSGSTSIAISSLRKLEFLGLARTMVDSMHEGMLHDLQFLSALDLSSNEFTKVPQELRFTHRLTVLNMDRNKFESLDSESFLGLEWLDDLSLNNNEKLKVVESETFGGLKSLATLHMSSCKRLETLSDGAFTGLVEKGAEANWTLKKIYLSDNGLSQIDEVLAPWDFVDYIDITNNPFRCDCNLEWMVKVLIPKIEKINPTLVQHITCAQPKAMRGKPILELMNDPDRFAKCKDSKDELFPDEISLIPSGSYRAAGITIVVIGVLLIVLGISVVGFLVIKRRAIAKALVAHNEIRYERADSDDDGISSIHTMPGKNRRGNAY